MVYPFKTKPFRHQLDAWEQNKNKKYFAYLMEMGTGKSKVLLDTAAYMYDSGYIKGILICANKGSYANWITNEIPEHWVTHIKVKTCLWRSNMGVRETEFLEKDFLAFPFEGIKIFVMNIEALAFDRSFNAALRFIKSQKTLMAIDESTTIKNQSAKRTKAAIRLGQFAVARRIMTGSVVDNRPLDAYSQFDFLEHGCLDFTSYYSFRTQYAEMNEMRVKTSPRPIKVVVGYKNIEDLRRRMLSCSFIVKKADCLDLPPKIYEKYNVELTPEQKKMYQDLVKKSIAEIGDSISSVKIVLTKLMRLHQLVCGHLKDDDGVVHDVPNNRLSALLEILDEVDGQVIIWANYREDIIAIEKTLKKEYGEGAVLTYFGDTTDEERNLAKEVFRRGSDTKGVRFVVGNPQTGGYGLTLTGANTVVYYSNSFDAEKRNQSEDRAHRIGQTDKVTYIDIVCKETVDEKILDALRTKKSLSDVITLSNWKDSFKN